MSGSSFYICSQTNKISPIYVHSKGYYSLNSVLVLIVLENTKYSANDLSNFNLSINNSFNSFNVT